MGLNHERLLAFTTSVCTGFQRELKRLWDEDFERIMCAIGWIQLMIETTGGVLLKAIELISLHRRVEWSNDGDMNVHCLNSGFLLLLWGHQI